MKEKMLVDLKFISDGETEQTFVYLKKDADYFTIRSFEGKGSWEKAEKYKTHLKNFLIK